MERKPLGRPAYGSIGHLPGSRLGPADHCVPQGQADICTVKCRKGDTVYVEEKLDGSCCAVHKTGDGRIGPLTRAGYLASSSRHEMHWLFAAWVADNSRLFDAMLSRGWRVVGEWIAQAHGTLYTNVDQPFVPFDIFDDDNRRIGRRRFCDILDPSPLARTKCVSAGTALPVDTALMFVRECIRPPFTTEPEGLVYRVERNDKVDFLAKWVRPDKQDGVYLPELSGCPAVWNWGPKADNGNNPA
jgi:hypothetical protein